MTNVPSRGLGSLLRKKKRQENELQEKSKRKLIRDFPFFKEIKPRKHFLFFSDYFKIDDSYATILTVFHHQGADDNLPAFWGIDLIPRNLGHGVSVRKLEHVGRVSESWINDHQGRAEGLLNNQMNELSQSGGSLSQRHRLSKQQEQLLEIASDLMNGSSYLRVAIRLLVKAKTLKDLDETVNKINRQYKDRFDTVYATAYVGEQRNELSNLYGKIDDKLGRNFMFTSAEFAGNYSLVTRGIEDKRGEYIGQMQGDVNNSAILMDVDQYDSHVVIAGHQEARTLSYMDGSVFHGLRGSDVWGIKLGQCALLRNRRVVHLILNRAKIDNVGVDLSDITSLVDMTRGDINPFEMFGEKKDSLSIFPAHLEKLELMVDQLKPFPKEISSHVSNALHEALNDFYVDKKMWHRNAQERRHLLRLVGIPHKEVPRLPEFLSYLNMRYEEQVQADAKDPDVLRAYGFLRGVFRDMLDSNGDLFNTTTSDVIDLASVSSRVIYDFSSLLKRSRGVMMAQFVNALGFSVGNLAKGDVLILHGVEWLDDRIKQYVRDKLDQLNDIGVRVVFVYGSVEKMIQDHTFNRFESADYTLLGGMTKPVIEAYQETLKQEVPIALRQLLEHKEPYRWYLRRGFDNIIFANDIQMGFEYA